MSTIVLTAADNGRSVEARPLDEIVVLLSENPTTGYRWHVEGTNEILELEGDGYAAAEPPPPDAEPSFGRGSFRELRFRARTPGSTRLELKHWQEWEGDSSVVERFTADIRVSGDPGQA